MGAGGGVVVSSESEALTEVRTLIAEVIKLHAGVVRTHHAVCYVSHSECLALLVAEICEQVKS